MILPLNEKTATGILDALRPLLPADLSRRIAELTERGDGARIAMALFVLIKGPGDEVNVEAFDPAIEIAEVLVKVLRALRLRAQRRGSAWGQKGKVPS